MQKRLRDGACEEELVGDLSPDNHKGLYQGWLVGALSPVNHKGLYQGW